MPLPKRTQESAPSIRAIASSAARTVGFSSRLYMYSPPSPRPYRCTASALSKRKVVDWMMGVVMGAFAPSGAPAWTATVAIFIRAVLAEGGQEKSPRTSCPGARRVKRFGAGQAGGTSCPASDDASSHGESTICAKHVDPDFPGELHPRTSALPFRSATENCKTGAAGRPRLLGGNQLLELGRALEAIEHRIGGQPAAHLDALLLQRLAQRGQRVDPAVPEGVERRYVVVQERVVRVQLAGFRVAALGLLVEALLRVGDAQVEPAIVALGLQPHHLVEQRDGPAVVAFVHQHGRELMARERILRVELD